MVVILGETSRLTYSLSKYYKNAIILNRNFYASWMYKENKLKIYEFLNELNKKHNDTDNIIFICASILDPNRAIEDHLMVNFFLVKNIIESVKNLNYRVVSFGTIMENIVPEHNQNNYLKSKFLLNQYITQLVKNENAQINHFQLHTLYGVNHPSSHMFLGQILSAIIEHKAFKMSSGLQIREYHHFDDVVLAMSCFLRMNLSGVIDISHGQPLRLRELAFSIFDFFNCLELLELGALPDPIDNYEKVYQKNEKIKHLDFRTSIDEINEYLKTFIN